MPPLTAGLAFVFEEPILELTATGRPVRVLEDWLPLWPGLYLYYSSRRHMPAPLQAFMRYAREMDGRFASVT